MRKHLLLVALLFCAVAARADFLIQQKAEMDGGGCLVIMNIKGDKIRVDSFCGPAGSAGKIMDLATGDFTTLMLQQKQALKEKINLNAPAKTSAAKLVALGQTETVAGYEAQMYGWTNNSSSGTVWVAKNFPDYAKIQPQLEKMSRLSAGNEPDVYALGMVVKIKEYAAGATTMSLTLISAKEGPVNASIFEIPKDFQIVAPPKN